MISFFDTSALIPVFQADHDHHDRSFEAFASARRGRGFCAAHSLLEFYSAMTRMPGRARLSAEQVQLFLDNIVERLIPIGLTSGEYNSVIKDAATKGILGGTIYDFLIARCALKARADTLYTWNVRHFEQFGPAIAKILKTP